jgi:protein-arginine kinase activator protein McsA
MARLNHSERSSVYTELFIVSSQTIKAIEAQQYQKAAELRDEEKRLLRKLAGEI